MQLKAFLGKHAEFLADKTPEIDIEGGRNSGKTWVCCAKVVQSCLDHPGIEWLICRYSGDATDTKLRPEFVKIAALMGVSLEWSADESAYWFPSKAGKLSKVFAYGLKTQSLEALFAKIRGLGVACVWNDQTEELPEVIGTELRFALRQQGYPHQLIFSPNPPEENHWLTDQFPEDEILEGRKLYQLELYDNRQNLDPQTIQQVEQAYPTTHVKYKSLVLGKRGVNIHGVPVYDTVFDRALHVCNLEFDPHSTLLEGLDAGKHHPVWVCAQRSIFGGIDVLGGILGKRLILEEFLLLVNRFRAEWFGERLTVRTCCDPQPEAEGQQLRFTNVQAMRDAGFKPRWRQNATAPDVREAVIQSISGHMQRRAGGAQSFRVNADPSRWLMASTAIVKQNKFFVDGLEGSYVWDEHYVSVGSKKVRQPKVHEWVDGGMRCLENIVLNFCTGPTEYEQRARNKPQSRSMLDEDGSGSGAASWMAS